MSELWVNHEEYYTAFIDFIAGSRFLSDYGYIEAEEPDVEGGDGDGACAAGGKKAGQGDRECGGLGDEHGFDGAGSAGAIAGSHGGPQRRDQPEWEGGGVGDDR